MRVSRYGGLEIPDAAKDYLEKCCECIEDLEELRLRYESDCAYKEGRKRLRGLDSVGNEYFFRYPRLLSETCLEPLHCSFVSCRCR